MLSPETIRHVDAVVAEAQSAGRAPSLVAGVVRYGALAHLATAGDLPAPGPDTVPGPGTAPGPDTVPGPGTAPGPDTQYRIGSITKTLTAVLVLQLRDEGRLDLDDPIGRYLTDTPLGPESPVGAVTLRQLLSHAGGLQREPESGQWWERSTGTDLATLLAGVTPEKLAHPPCRTYHYSNLAYGLLGAVLQRVTGEAWWKLLRARLLDPLAMSRTSYQPEEPFARGYLVHPWHGTVREEPRTDTGAMAPAGQLWSTARDLARWAGFLADPDPSVLLPATLTEMCAPVMMLDPETWTSAHGLGVMMHRHGERVYVGHGGSMPGYVAMVLVHRRSRTGVVAYANAYGLRDSSIGALAQRLLSGVLDREPPPPPRPWRPASPPPPELAELTGRWWFMGREFEAAWHGMGGEADDPTSSGELVISQVDPNAPEPWRFTPTGTDRWRGRSGMNDGEILSVRRDAAGRIDTLDIATFVFTRDPDLLG